MTDAPSWRRVKEVFQAAIERQPDERAAFVLHACGDDDALRLEVESLLASLEDAGSFVESPVIHRLLASDSDDTGRHDGSADVALAPGDPLGPYRIVELIGAGGMGQVYRATDPKLNRDVALKILPDVFATDPDRLVRFRREAQVLASLNHPNIGQIFGIEDGGVRQALVLELVDGPTLAEMIAPGGRRTAAAIDLGDALGIALQVARALEAAHTQGVVHRDLKPANIKVRPDGLVKVLDFGLARAIEAAPTSSVVSMESMAATAPADVTRSDVILGTAAYMSPEQARGQVVDNRADIWAFGCVLFEMLSGFRAFRGDSSAEAMARLLAYDPDWTVLPAATPTRIRRLLERCLEKDDTRRLRDVGDARHEIQQQIDELGTKGATSGRTPLLARWPVRIAGVAVALASVVAILEVSRARRRPSLHYTPITDFSDSATAPSLSPDGRMLTFLRGGTYFQNSGQIGQIYLKRLPDGDVVRLTNDPRRKFAPVFTPDGSHVAFSLVERGAWDTWSVPVLGGEVQRIRTNASGLTWMTDGRVLFSAMKGSGFHMGIVTAADVGTDQREIYFPAHERAMAHFSYASPDRKWVLVVEMGPGGGFTERCRLVPFDGRSTGELVGPVGRCLAAAWSPDGRWMYFGAHVDSRSHIWRQAFPNGRPEQITFDPNEEEGLAVAPDGHSIVTSVGEARTTIWMHDDAGDRQLTSEGSVSFPRVSGDGRGVFYLQRSDLMRLDLASGTSTRVLPDVPITGYGYDVSRDATEVAFTRHSAGEQAGIWIAALDGRSPPRQITSGGNSVSFGPDGLLIFRQADGTSNYLFRVRKDGSGRERVTDAPIMNKSNMSPDGDWVIATRAMTGEDVTQTGERVETIAVPIRGGPFKRICAFDCGGGTGWSADGTSMYMSAGPNRAVVMPVPPGQPLPDLPATGLRSPAEALTLPGARAIDQRSVIATLGASTYVFQKTEIRRNLFRIQLR